jgi:very-short-patch-repair endonuclease
VRHRFWTTKQLRDAGFSRAAIRSRVAAHELLFVRRGHYATPGTPAPLIRAVRMGGLATATSAAAARGLWVPPHAPLSVAVPINTPRLRDPDDPDLPYDERSDVRLHWTSHLDDAAAVTGMVGTELMVQHLLESLAPEHAVAVLDSALHERALHERELDVLAARLPDRLAPLLSVLDGRCESGMESVARYLLQRLGLHVEVQVQIEGVGRVDLLVEGRLIIELDGRQYHPDFEADRYRDAQAASRGYRTLRFTWKKVLFEWPWVQSVVLAALA